MTVVSSCLHVLQAFSCSLGLSLPSSASFSQSCPSRIPCPPFSKSPAIVPLMIKTDSCGNSASYARLHFLNLRYPLANVASAFLPMQPGLLRCIRGAGCFDLLVFLKGLEICKISVCLLYFLSIVLIPFFWSSPAQALLALPCLICLSFQ